MKAPNPLAFAKKAAEFKANAAAAPTPTGYIHLQVRLDYDDAERFRAAARRRRLTLQSALIEAVNRLLGEWGEAPVPDPGTRHKGQSRGGEE